MLIQDIGFRDYGQADGGYTISSSEFSTIQDGIRLSRSSDDEVQRNFKTCSVALAEFTKAIINLYTVCTPCKMSCRVLEVTARGDYDWRQQPISGLALRNAATRFSKSTYTVSKCCGCSCSK